MYNYEIMLIVKSNINKDELDNVKKFIKDNLDGDAKINDWGNRDLAYDINHTNQGHYLVVHVNTTPESIKNLSNRVNINKSFVRFMAINLDKETNYDAKFTVDSPAETKWIEREKKPFQKRYNDNRSNFRK